MEPVPVRCRIPELLLRLGKDQQWLAEETEKSKSQISDYVTLRKVMNLRTSALFAYVLKCKIDDIYVWDIRKQK